MEPDQIDMMSEQELRIEFRKLVAQISSGRVQAFVSNSCPALNPSRLHHGFTIQQIFDWRSRESAAGRPCGLYDFYNAHGIPHGRRDKQPIANSTLDG